MDGVITVDKTYMDGRWDTTKNDKTRFIQIGRHLVDLLATYKEVATEKTTDDTVFANRSGKPLDWRNFLNRDYGPLRKSLGLPSATPHSLRHTYISALISSGEEPTFVQTQAGHSDLKMTLNTYTHPLAGRDPQAGARIDAALETFLDS